MMSLKESVQLKNHPASCSRILDIPCKVCGDFSSGKHYNIYACDGCAGFFKRSIRRARSYICKSKSMGVTDSCTIDKTRRNQCRACRLQKCHEVGMNKDAVQHERGPRNATIRRQLSCIADMQRGIISPGASPPLPPIHPLHPFYMRPMPQVPPVLPMPMMPFIPPPPPQIYESAAQLLFLNVQWIISSLFFGGLPMHDKKLLLQESWRELFVLACALFLPACDITPLANMCLIILRHDKYEQFMKNVREFQDTIFYVRQYRLDNEEFEYLRSILLLKTDFSRPDADPSSIDVLMEKEKIENFRRQTEVDLHRYVSTVHPTDNTRFAMIMGLVAYLKKVKGETIVELFFRRTIGNSAIENIIWDMYMAQAKGKL